MIAAIVITSGCASTNYCNLDRMLTPEGHEFERREDYIKAAGLDQNPANPVVAINVTPYPFHVNTVPALVFRCDRCGNAELCIAKAIKEVIPNAAVYFGEGNIVYMPYKFKIGDNALLVRRSEIVSGVCEFAEFHGYLKINNETIKLNGGACESHYAGGNAGRKYWLACLDIANQIADELIKRGILRESDVKKADVPK